MSIRVFYEADADPSVLHGRTIAVLGYGSQGRAHALNLRDSGHQVIVAQRTESPRFDEARRDGFAPVTLDDAARNGDLLILALPDDAMGETYDAQIAPHLRAGHALGFIHGFNIRFGRITPPADVDVVMVAPKGPGPMVRDAYKRGGGLTCVVAVHQDATGNATRVALAWGAGVGGGRGGMIETTFAVECETDLFGEQAVLCGGILELMKTAYDVLVEAGLPPEMAYFECIHEVKHVVDLQHAIGFADMRRRISTTAAYGGLTRGPRLIGPEIRDKMRTILSEIRDGRFAEEWIACRKHDPEALRRLIDSEAAHPAEAAGAAVRSISNGSATQTADG